MAAAYDSDDDTQHMSLADRMRAYETPQGGVIPAVLDPSKPFIVRLDGHCFSGFTRNFEKPFDLRIHRAMLKTSADLLREYSPAMVYTASDEISMVFPFYPDEEAMAAAAAAAAAAGTPAATTTTTTTTTATATAAPGPLPPRALATFLFGGRVVKIIGIFAGYASARFNMHLQAEAYDTALEQRLRTAPGFFDARLIQFPDNAEALENIFWRATDTRRNSISMLAQCHFAQKRLNRLGGGEMIRLLRAERGIDWHQASPFYRFGTLLKKRTVMKNAMNPMTKQEVVAQRTEIAKMPLNALRTPPLTVAQQIDWMCIKTLPLSPLLGEHLLAFDDESLSQMPKPTTDTSAAAAAGASSSTTTAAAAAATTTAATTAAKSTRVAE